MSTERAHILGCLIRLECGLKETKSKIKEYPFDSAFPLVLVSPSDIISVLCLYRSGRVDGECIAEWADFLESRDDVGFSLPYQIELRLIMQKLANPVLFGVIDDGLAERMIKELEGYS